MAIPTAPRINRPVSRYTDRPNRTSGTILDNPALSTTEKVSALPEITTAPKIIESAPTPVSNLPVPKQSSSTTYGDAAPIVSSGVSAGGFTAAGTAAGAIVGSVVPGIGTAVGAAVGAGVGSLIDMFMSWDDAEKQNAQIREQNALMLRERRKEQRQEQANIDRQRKDLLEAQNFNRGLGYASRLRESMFSTPDFQSRLINIQKSRR